MLAQIKTYGFVLLTGFVLGLIAMFLAVNTESSDTLVPALVSVPTHTLTATVTAQDKRVLRKAKVISKKIEQDPKKEVLATGTITDDSGTRIVVAVLNKPDGNTQLVETRKLAEWMRSHEVGAGWGFVGKDEAKALQYRFTFARGANLYGTAQVAAYQVDRIEDRKFETGFVFLNMRF